MSGLSEKRPALWKLLSIDFDESGIFWVVCAVPKCGTRWGLTAVDDQGRFVVERCPFEEQHRDQHAVETLIETTGGDAPQGG